ncbi:hypothetical protein, partial [Bacteroides caecimuris]|uniref:hypothetical protein n=1 Tax=Bacteroides caecimuris TaxID=1796613 RepID=UPI002658DBA9
QVIDGGWQYGIIFVTLKNVLNRNFPQLTEHDFLRTSPRPHSIFSPRRTDRVQRHRIILRYFV